MTTLAQLLSTASARLEAVSETPRLDAEILLGHVLEAPRARLLAQLREAVSPEAATAFETLLLRRLNHEPIAYILGNWEFFSITFHVRAPMLVPRPETEHLVEVALEHLAARRDKADVPPRVLDLCTGTGCVALAIAQNVPEATVVATDVSPAAVALARDNAALLGLPVAVYEGDLFGALPMATPPFDVIVSNPPYVSMGEWEELPAVIRKHEDPGALLAGADGLDLIRCIIDASGAWLAPGGLLALEMGETQYDAVAVFMRTAGFRDIGSRRDLGGWDRIAFGIRGVRE